MILGILVTYNPEIASLKKNILSIIKQVDNIVIFDNASDNFNLIYDFYKTNNILFYNNKKNIGLASAYNFVITRHINNFDYFVTFDQDTFIQENLINKMLPYFGIDSSIRIVAPRFDIKKGFNRDYTFTDAVIQSSTIFSSKLINEIGLFNDYYFIDCVDFEYCLRARLCGFKILQLNNLSIIHQLGSTKKSFGINYYTHNYIRNYYISRNHIILTRKYIIKFPFFILKKNIYFTLFFLKLLLLEREFTKLKYFFFGLINYKINLNKQ